MTKTLEIVGIVDLSTVDEINRPVSVIFLQGCNANCHFCHNIESLNKEKTKNIEVIELIDRLQENDLIDGVIFSGGEPTLQCNLIEFIRELGEVYTFIGLDTNGTNPESLKELSEYVSRIAMDIKASFKNYQEVMGYEVDVDKIKESVDILIEFSKNKGRVEFRTTFVPELISIDEILEIGNYLKEKGFTGNYGSFYVIQQYIKSEGVRKKYRDLFTIPKPEDMMDVAIKLWKNGLPMAIRTREKGLYVLGD